MKKKIFLSSTSYDLDDERKELAKFLEEECEQEVVYFESPDFKVKGGFHSHDVCIDAVEGCDILLLIINERYGGTYSGKKYTKYKESINKNISVTWAETAFAYEKGIQVFTCVNQNTDNEKNDYKKSKKAGSNFTPQKVKNLNLFDFIDYINKQPVDNYRCFYNDINDLKKHIVGRLGLYFKNEYLESLIRKYKEDYVFNIPI